MYIKILRSATLLYRRTFLYRDNFIRLLCLNLMCYVHLMNANSRDNRNTLYICDTIKHFIATEEFLIAKNLRNNMKANFFFTMDKILIGIFSECRSGLFRSPFSGYVTFPAGSKKRYPHSI